VLVTLGLIGAYLYESNGLPTFNSSYEVQVAVPSAQGIATFSNVRIAGVAVGRVTGVRQQGIAAVLTLRIDGAHSPLPVGTRAAIRLRTLVGENYVELDPTDAKASIPNGGMIPMNDVADYVNVDQILDTLQGPTRTRAREFIQSLGGALSSRGDELGSVVGGAAGVINNITPTLTTLDGDRAQLGSLVQNLGAVSNAVAERGTSLRVFANRARTTFQAIASRDAALRQVIDQLPSTLTQVRTTSGVLEKVTGQAAPVINNLAAAVTELTPAIDDLHPAAVEGRSVLRTVAAAAPPLTTTLAKLRQSSPSVVATLPLLQNTLCQANPALKYASPYTGELSAFIHNLASITNYYDATGHAARLFASVGPLSGAIEDQTSASAVKLLLQNNVIGKFYQEGYDPLPPPGQAGNTTIGKGLLGPSDWAQSHPYPHITAEC
jgi:phospholipid/cholesterol/gamma-HCH transport system substrate-binding protein